MTTFSLPFLFLCSLHFSKLIFVRLRDECFFVRELVALSVALSLYHLLFSAEVVEPTRCRRLQQAIDVLRLQRPSVNQRSLKVVIGSRGNKYSPFAPLHLPLSPPSVSA